MAKMTNAELDAAYAKYQASQQKAPLQGQALDEAYAKYQAQQSQPQTINAGSVNVQSPSKSSQAQSVLNSIYAPSNNTIGKAADFVNSIPFGVMQNASDLGTGALNLAKDFSNTVTQSTLPPNMQTHFKEENPYNFKGLAPSQGGALTGEIGSALLMPNLAGARVAQAASKIPMIGAKVAPYVPTALTGGVYGGLYGAANPNSNLANNVGLGALLPVGLQSVGRAISGAFARPLNKLEQTANQEQALGIPNATLTPAQAAERLKVAQEAGANPTLGQITNSQKLNEKYENAAYAPFSNERTKANQFLGQLQKFGTGIYHNLFGDIDHMQANPTILRNVKGVYDANKATDKANYDNIATMADEAGIKPMRNSAQKYAQEQLDKHENRLKANINSPLKGEKDVLDMLETTAKNVGPEHPYTFNEIKEERSAVGETLQKLKESSPKSTTAQKVLEDLYKKYTDDMGAALKQSGDDTLKSAWEQANKYHAENVAPFRNGKLPYILKKNEHESVINELLNNSEHAGVVDMLSPETRKLILGSKLLPNASELKQKIGPNGEIISETNISPLKLGNAYRKLNVGKNANAQNLLKGLTHNVNGKEVPLPQAMNNLGLMQDMYENVKKVADMPPTGYVTKSISRSFGPALAGLLGGSFGGLGTALGGAAALTAASAGANKLAAKYLRNPKVLEAYINKNKREQLLNSMLPSAGLGGILNKLPINYPAGLASLINQGQ